MRLDSTKNYEMDGVKHDIDGVNIGQIGFLNLK